MTGVASMNEKRAADSRVRLRKSPAAMVMPAREVPGMTATAWARPMVRASFRVRLSAVRASEGRRSATHISSATPTNIAAIKRGARNAVSA